MKNQQMSKICPRLEIYLIHNEIDIIEELEVEALNPCTELALYNDWSSMVTAWKY